MFVNKILESSNSGLNNVLALLIDFGERHAGGGERGRESVLTDLGKRGWVALQIWEWRVKTREMRVFIPMGGKFFLR